MSGSRGRASRHPSPRSWPPRAPAARPRSTASARSTSSSRVPARAARPRSVRCRRPASRSARSRTSRPPPTTVAGRPSADEYENPTDFSRFARKLRGDPKRHERDLMARYTGADCKRCRREKMKLFLKGSKCDGPKCPFESRPFPPGQHGRGRPKETEYLLQLREKQKARRIYGVLERQFAGYFDEAVAKPGKTGEELLKILESRLDNVVYRAGLATSRDAARQLVNHG